MLHIRPEQFDVFQDSAEEAFLDELLAFARAELGVWVAQQNDAILRERIKSGIARARSHGFELRSSLAKFVVLMLRFCPNFDQDPDVAALLERADLLPEARADLLFTRISPAQWAAIEETYEPAEWQSYATGPVL